MKFQKWIEESLGKNTGREGTGGAGMCICPECDYTTPHKKGIPCNTITCPKCGAKMTGEGAVGQIKDK